MTIKRNLSVILVSQIITLAVNVGKIVFIPLILSKSGFSYWQIYLFYSSFVGFFQFGINDGIYLRYAGRKIGRIQKRLLKSQFQLLIISQLIISIGVVLYSYFILDSVRQEIFYFFAACITVTGSLAFFWFYYQSTNQIKKYVSIIISEKIIFVFIPFLLVLVNYPIKFELFIYSDLISKIIILSYCIWRERDIFLQQRIKSGISILELQKNIDVGIKLMLANISSMLIIGSFRFVIDLKWPLNTFGEVSFSLTIVSMFLMIMNSISIVLFPILKKIDNGNLKSAFEKLEKYSLVFFPFSILMFYPLTLIIDYVFKEYSNSVIYMGYIYPIIFLEIKNQILISTFFKSIRKESAYLKINFLLFLISLGLSFIAYYYVSDLAVLLNLIVVCILLKYILGISYIKYFLNFSSRQIVVNNFIVSVSVIGVAFVMALKPQGELFLNLMLSSLPFLFLQTRKGNRK